MYSGVCFVDSIKHYHFYTMGSTNSWSKKWAHTFDPNIITTVTAEEQTAGRGQHGRKWVSPVGLNLYLSLTFFVPEDFTFTTHSSLFMGWIAAETLMIRGIQPQLKWPNDLFLRGKKVGGFLCESLPTQNKRAVVCGAGINLNSSKEHLEAIDQPASSLLLETGQKIDIPTFYNIFVGQFEQSLPKFLEEGMTSYLLPYKALLINPEKFELS